MPLIDRAVIEKLKSALPNLHALTPDSLGYKKSLERSMRNTEKPAICALSLRSPNEFSSRSSKTCFGQDNSLDIAVRGGGHSASGASSTDGGMCIDLCNMQAVSVDTGTMHVTVQGGALWRDVYLATESFGVALVGGICGNVGVGGSALVGGYGWLTGAHGLALDNIVEAEIVLADSSIVTASSSKNPDLYWAIRGAGPCFGIVTSIIFQGYKQGSVWHGDLMFPPSALTAVVEFMNYLLRVSKGESSAILMMGMLPGMADPALVVQVYYDGTESKAKEFFAPLLKLQPIGDSTKMKSFAGTTGGGDDLPPGLGEVTSGGIMVPIDSVFLESLYKDYLAFVKVVPDASETIIAYETHPTYEILLHGQTETAFPNRGTFGNVIISARYTKEETAVACKEWCRAMHDKVHKEFVRRKMVDNVDEVTKTAVGEYINYDGLGESPERLYGVNYKKLVAFKKIYDPQNVFNKCVDLLPRSDTAVVQQMN